MNTLVSILKTSTNKNLFIDFDGTLACSSLDKRFNNLISKSNHEDHISNVISWYRNTYVNNLKLNHLLIIQLIILKLLFNYKLILWTNRGEENIPMTKSNLGIYWLFFNKHIFFGGQKGDKKRPELLHARLVARDARSPGRSPC